MQICKAPPGSTFFLDHFPRYLEGPIVDKKPAEVETRRRLTAFYAADIDGNGELNVEQYLSAMDALGYTPDAERELRVVFDEADTDGNGIIDINEFLVSVAKHESND